MTEPLDSVRVDKWLWAARVFKTRSLAAHACDGGKVDVNAQAAKPAKPLRPGDVVHVTLSQGRRRILKVTALDERRRSPVVARTLFEEALALRRDLDAAAVVSDWWQTYLANKPAWPIALAALDQMFG